MVIRTDEAAPSVAARSATHGAALIWTPNFHQGAGDYLAGMARMTVVVQQKKKETQSGGDANGRDGARKDASISIRKAVLAR